MRDGEMHAMAALGAILFSAALSIPTVFMAAKRMADGPPLEDMEVIEASLAYKKPSAPRQPQKPRNAPQPEVKPEGVSRDETRPVDPVTPFRPDETPITRPGDPVDPLAKFRRPDTDLETGSADDQEGAADGSEFGRGTITKGDPYFQRLWADLDWTIPELAKGSDAPTVACLLFSPDGKIAKVTFKSKGDDDVATLADKAMKELETKRNASPEEVPTHLLQRLTTRGICFNLTAT